MWRVLVAAAEFGSMPSSRVVPEGVPGPGMAAALDGVEVGALSDEELTEVMAAWRRMTSWAQACELAMVAELGHRREERHSGAPAVRPAESLSDEIALALTLSSGAAGMWARLACELAERLPRTLRALAEGRIDLARAKIIADGLLDVDTGTAALVEQAVLGEAESVTAGRLRRRLREVIKAVNPQAAEQRRQRARKVRSLEKWATAAGTCALAFHDMTEEDAEAIYNRINAVAQAMKADGDARPIDAIRHDLGVALLHGAPLPQAARALRPCSTDSPQATTAQSPAAPPPPPPDETPRSAAARPTPRHDRSAGDHHDAVAGVATHITGLLAEVIDERLRTVAGRHLRSGRNTGLALRVTAALQAISSALIVPKRSWCQTTSGQSPADLRTGTEDGHRRGGHVEHGRQGYRPSAAMRRLIENTYQVCAFPTCDRPAPRCDLDHTVPWHEGGPTCPCNLAPLCRRHHRLKQHPRWHLSQPWPGLLIWVTPAGKWHTVIPEDRQ